MLPQRPHLPFIACSQFSSICTDRINPTCQIIDSRGIVVGTVALPSNMHTGKNTVRIDLNNLSPGVYNCYIEDAKSQLVRAFVVK